MLLGLLLLWSVLIPGSFVAPKASLCPQTEASQSPSTSPATRNDARPPEHAPTPPAQQEDKGPPSSNQPAQSPVAQPENKPAEQAPVTSSPSSGTSVPVSQGAPESKPGEVAPPAAKPEAGQAAAPKKHKIKSKKQKGAAVKTNGPKKVIVRNGGTEEAFSQLAPDMSNEEASHARETTGQLLSATDSNLQLVATRTLNQDQQAMVEQIRTFMGQSNAAVKAGDLQRGHNLALKALLLSNDLVKH